jgi:hypothetical protein
MAGQATFSLEEDDLEEADAGSDFFADLSAEPLLAAESLEVLDEPESPDCLSFFSGFSEVTGEDPFLLSVR